MALKRRFFGKFIYPLRLYKLSSHFFYTALNIYQCNIDQNVFYHKYTHDHIGICWHKKKSSKHHARIKTFFHVFSKGVRGIFWFANLGKKNEIPPDSPLDPHRNAYFLTHRSFNPLFFWDRIDIKMKQWTSQISIAILRGKYTLNVNIYSWHYNYVLVR